MEIYSSVVDKLKEVGVDKIQYKVESSVFDPIPKGVLVFDSDLPTDCHNFFIGTGVPFYFKKTNATNSTMIKLPSFSVVETSCGGSAGIAKFHSRIELAATSMISGNYNIKNSYQAKNGKEVIEDILSSSNQLKGLETDITATDNPANLNRSLGQPEVSFIMNEVLDAYLIGGEKPVFYLGLDNKLYFTSLRKLNQNKENNVAILQIGSEQGDLAKSFIASKKNDFNSGGKNKFKNLNFNTQNATFSIKVGANGSFRDLGGVYYFTDYSSPLMLNLKGKHIAPVNPDGARLPVVTTFFSNDYAGGCIQNRPNMNIDIELSTMLNYSASKLIEVVVEGVSIDYEEPIDDSPILQAGFNILLVLPYLYSVYNGVYTVTKVEHLMEDKGCSSRLTMHRMCVEEEWAELIKVHKAHASFPYEKAVAATTGFLHK